MGFDFYVGVVADYGNMANLPVRGIKWKLADHGCDVRGDYVEASDWVTGCMGVLVEGGTCRGRW